MTPEKVKFMKRREYSESEYRMEELYPSRVIWHAQGILNGQYGMVIKDLKSLPVNSPAAIDTLADTHHYLCKYYLSGSQDPYRERILMDIGKGAMSWITRNAEFISAEELPNKKRNTTISELRERFDHHLEGVLESQLQQLIACQFYSQDFFERLDLVFDLIWTTLELDQAEHQLILHIIEQPEYAFISRTIIPALFLGLMEYFDIEKLVLLKECLEQSSNVHLQAVALASLIILGRRHQDELLALHSDFVHQVSLLMSREDISPFILSTIKVITTAYKTTENHKIFREKILPELSNISDKLQQVMGNNLQERLDKLREIDRDKMEEVERLMLDSSSDNFAIMRDPDQDVTYHLVTDLKKFPFFNQVSHWFMPYDARYPGIDQENAEALARLAPMLFQGRQIISSDMYSYAQVNAWKNVEESLRIQMEGMPIPDTLPKTNDFVAAVEDFVYGAYRFYQLSHFSFGMIHPFEHKPYVGDGAFLQQDGILSEANLHELASLMVKYREYADAANTYERMLSEYMTASGEVYRGLAVASMMKGDSEKALEMLLRAVDIEGKSKVTVRKVAELMVKLGRKREAIKWLEQSENELVDDAGILALDRAKLLRDLGEYQEALQVGFKANFLTDGTSEEVVAFLSELLLQQNRAEEALKMLDKEGAEKGERLLLKGLAHLALGHRELGIEDLKKWMSQGGDGAILSEHLAQLSIYGFESWEQSLVQDIIFNLIDGDESN